MHNLRAQCTLVPAGRAPCHSNEHWAGHNTTTPGSSSAQARSIRLARGTQDKKQDKKGGREAGAYRPSACNLVRSSCSGYAVYAPHVLDTAPNKRSLPIQTVFVTIAKLACRASVCCARASSMLEFGTYIETGGGVLCLFIQLSCETAICAKAWPCISSGPESFRLIATALGELSEILHIIWAGEGAP